MTKKQYLGDSVYVDFDGFGLVLTTENGYGPSNRIVLEPEVFEALAKYVERLKASQPQPIEQTMHDLLVAPYVVTTPKEESGQI